MSPDSNRLKDLNTHSYKSIIFFLNPPSTNYRRRRRDYVAANLAIAMTTITANAAVATGYRHRCHHHPLPPATILPFFPSLWHGGVDSLPATLFPTFSAILSRPGEKMARSGRERRVGGEQLRERPDQAHKVFEQKPDSHQIHLFL
ncbi:hypothetical protein Scep_023251 [Stephania cephalantha]|uniref:Uncharacterized protein n=1 Tax=Stephania cephalantha TaxID=152367 RepID=A0AAP0EV81_9MAGN